MTAAHRVIVTGGSGRLGRSVVSALAAAGYSVVSIDRVPHDGLPADQRQVDLLDATAATAAFQAVAPTAVVHLAAIAVPGSLPDPEIFRINTQLIWNVLEASKASGTEALLVASSPTVIGYGSPSGWSPSFLPVDETHPLAPWNGYAVSKAAIEEIVHMAVRRDGERLRLGVFRPCYVIAPEEWNGAPTQQGHTVAERLADPALSAVALYNYVDARDAADFVIAWIDKAPDIPNGGVFFVGAPDSLLNVGAASETPSAAHSTAQSVREHASTGAIFSSAHAADVLGWRATRTWRTELGAPSPTSDTQESTHV